MDPTGVNRPALDKQRLAADGAGPQKRSRIEANSRGENGAPQDGAGGQRDARDGDENNQDRSRLDGQPAAGGGADENSIDWAALIQLHGPLVWRTVNRLLPGSADSEDCFQKTFVSAWQFSAGRVVRNWPALLRRIATARALERSRELIRRQARLTTLPAEGVVDQRTGDPANDAIAMELHEALRRALAEIHSREALVFCLICLEGLSYQEVGSQLGLTVNHVGVLLNRARSRLRARLSPAQSESDNTRTPAFPREKMR